MSMNFYAPSRVSADFGGVSIGTTATEACGGAQTRPNFQACFTADHPTSRQIFEATAPSSTCGHILINPSSTTRRQAMNSQGPVEQRGDEVAKVNPDVAVADNPLERTKERTDSISQQSDDSQTAAE